jgi:hypothetical protein
MVTCDFAPRRALIGGAPTRPRSATSQPAWPSTWWRAAASAVTCAIWLPVTKANDASGGIASKSASQAPATSSTTAAAGPPT